jgi:uncharacterized protein YkwD
MVGGRVKTTARDKFLQNRSWRMKRFAAFAVFILLLSMAVYADTVPAAGGTPQENAKVAMTPEETRFVDLVNTERAKQGLSKLSVDPLLIKVARGHSKEMSDKKYFSHNSPTPGLATALDRYLAAVKARPAWALVGENLYYCSRVDVSGGHTALMNSPLHRKNILEPRYKSIGVGACINSKGEFYITQMFLTRVK